MFAPSQALLHSVVSPAVFVSHSEASAEATHIISAIGEVPSVPAPLDTEGAAVTGQHSNLVIYLLSVTVWFVMVALDICHFSCSSHPAECKDCEHHAEGHASEESPVVKEALKERPAEEVTARLAQQEQEETDVLTCRLPSVQLTAAAFPSSVQFSKTLKAESPEA